MSNPIRRQAVGAVRSAASRVRWARYDHYHRSEVVAALDVMARHNDRRLTRSQKHECDSYAKAFLGSSAYAPWLYLYTVVQGEFKEGWLPDNYYGHWVVPAQSKLLRGAAATKSLSRRILQTPALPDVAYVIDGRLHDLDMNVITARELRDGLDSSIERLVFKKDGTSQGRGVEVLAVDRLDDIDFESRSDGVVQEWIRQHHVMEDVLPGAVASIRLTTVKEPDGSFTQRTGLLKFGRSGNAWVRSQANYRVAVVSPEGDLAPTGYAADWREWSAHPDTGVAVAGRRIPRFADAVRLSLELHASVPQVGAIGWDLAVDVEDRVRVMEWNVGHAGITFAEATTGPCFTGLGWDRLHR